MKFTEDQKSQLRELYLFYGGRLLKFSGPIDKEKAEIIMFGTDEEKLKVLVQYQENEKIPFDEKSSEGLRAADNQLTANTERLKADIERAKDILLEAGLITAEEAAGKIKQP